MFHFKQSNKQTLRMPVKHSCVVFCLQKRKYIYIFLYKIFSSNLSKWEANENKEGSWKLLTSKCSRKQTIVGKVVDIILVNKKSFADIEN